MAELEILLEPGEQFTHRAVPKDRPADREGDGGRKGGGKRETKENLHHKQSFNLTPIILFSEFSRTETCTLPHGSQEK